MVGVDAFSSLVSAATACQYRSFLEHPFLLPLLFPASVPFLPSLLNPPFLVPVVLPASISSLERFILPALLAFPPLPPGGEAPLGAELDADARAVAACACVSWYIAMRLLRAAFCSALSVFG